MDLKEVFAPGGLIASRLDRYEHRPQQLRMAAAVSQAFADAIHLVVEAGTGVGKSFAYLIPAIDFSINESERVVISTNTISLQEQLINKDIPFLQEILPDPFKVVLVKGRANYLCLRRLEGLMMYERGLFEAKEEVDDLNRIQQWAKTTKDGSRSDLEPQPIPSVWNRVCSERDMCLGPVLCSHAKQCFYQKARNAMYNANILVVNHHLLFSDLALRRDSDGFSVLPNYEYVIMDEAQNIENTATEHMGISLSNFGVRHLMDSLCHRDRRGGLFVRLDVPALADLVDATRKQSDLFFDSVESWFANEPSGTKRIQGRNFVPNVLDGHILDLQSELQKLKPVAKNDEEEKEIAGHMERCKRLRDELDTLLSQAMDDSVYWAEISRGRYRTIRLNTAPVNVSDELKPNLFEAMESIIMTSATLSTNRNFDYFKKRVGLNGCREMMLGSPFNYEEQVRIYIPPGMPDPRDSSAFIPAAIEKIKEYIQLTHGKAFVLFTSYKMMDEVYEELESWLAEQNITAFSQGKDLSRHAMLEKFKSDIDSVLFGTSSFWEGVDVQGEALSSVIVVRLPFSVPTHPVVEARIEDIQTRGGNSFMEYNLPEAIIRLKQGFGRLIRTQNDAGIVAILDPRIRTKFYGKWFLNSLPKCQIVLE
ncbi:ATP-dependent DNA helicase [Candidatus Poribacteria bacterium]